MTKTYLIGETESGAIVARASASDQGYTHAATFAGFKRGQVIPLNAANFSRSLAGAIGNYSRENRKVGFSDIEGVTLRKVDRAEYKTLTGKS